MRKIYKDDKKEYHKIYLMPTNCKGKKENIGSPNGITYQNGLIGLQRIYLRKTMTKKLKKKVILDGHDQSLRLKMKNIK